MTLAGAEETRLIGLGYAVTDLDGPGNTPLPVTSTTNLTGGSEIPVDDLTVFASANNTKQIRRVVDFYANEDATAYVGAVSGAATSALNTTIGTSGATAFGRRAWRLTTEALNGSYAEVTCKQANTNYMQNIAHIDPSLPLIVIIAPHATNAGSHLKIAIGEYDVTTAGVATQTGDMYIPGTISGEQQAVIPLIYNMRSLTALSKTADFGATPMRLRLQAYQEGTSGITDITILGVYQAQEVPVVHLGFDDGLKSVYDYAFPILQARGLTASVAVMGAQVGLNEAGRQSYGNLPLMIKPELDELVAAGWEITVHGIAGITGLNYADSLALLQAQKSAVEALGYTESSAFYVYPGGVGNWTTDGDGEPIGPKALTAAGFIHARLLWGSGSLYSHAFNGLGKETLWQDSLCVNPFRSASIPIHETADYAAKTKANELMLEKISESQCFVECLTHNVVPRAVFPSGQPYIGDGYTGTVSISNDVSVEMFTAFCDSLAYYRDLGLIDVQHKRDWYAGVSKTMEDRLYRNKMMFGTPVTVR